MVGLLVFFHKHFCSPSICASIFEKVQHICGSLFFESKRYHILISDFIFKSQFLPRSKISNLLRFWISIDLNILKGFLGEKCGQFLMFSDKKESFFHSPSIHEGGRYVPKMMSFYKRFLIFFMRKLFRISSYWHITHHKKLFVAFVQSVATR